MRYPSTIQNRIKRDVQRAPTPFPERETRKGIFDMTDSYTLHDVIYPRHQWLVGRDGHRYRRDLFLGVIAIYDWLVREAGETA